MNYISQEGLRQLITAGTNRSEAFNKFAKWLSFGRQVISRNNRDAQRKIIKYNHIVANCLIFHNMVDLSQALRQSLSSDSPATAQLIATLSPYQTEHINLFCSYLCKLIIYLLDENSFEFEIMKWEKLNEGRG